MKTYCIYRIQNTITGKSYIGCTLLGINTRWKAHIKSSKDTSLNSKFYAAIRKYGVDNWIRGEIVCNIPKLFVSAFEMYWINYYASVTDGYNISPGGLSLTNVVRPSGDAHPLANTNTFTIYDSNDNYKEYTGTMTQLSTELGIRRNYLRSLYNKEIASTAGFTLTDQKLLKEPKQLKIDLLYRNATLMVLEMVMLKKSLPKYCESITMKEAYIDIDLALNGRSLLHSYNKDHPIYRLYLHTRFLGNNNAIKGIARPQHVKDAVSRRMKDSADKTRRDWMHPEHGVELEITSLELRDKYNLNISHLKNITDNKPKYKTHKGWQLYARNNN